MSNLGRFIEKSIVQAIRIEKQTLNRAVRFEMQTFLGGRMKKTTLMTTSIVVALAASQVFAAGKTGDSTLNNSSANATSAQQTTEKQTVLRKKAQYEQSIAKFSQSKGVSLSQSQVQRLAVNMAANSEIEKGITEVLNSGGSKLSDREVALLKLTSLLVIDAKYDVVKGALSAMKLSDQGVEAQIGLFKALVEAKTWSQSGQASLLEIVNNVTNRIDAKETPASAIQAALNDYKTKTGKTITLQDLIDLCKKSA